MNLIETIVRKTIRNYISENKTDMTLLQQAANDTLDAIRNYLENSKYPITIEDNPLQGKIGRDNHVIFGSYYSKHFVIYDHYNPTWEKYNYVEVCILTHDIKNRKDSFDTSIPSIYDHNRYDLRVRPMKETISELFSKLTEGYDGNKDFNTNSDNINIDSNNFRKNKYLKLLNIFEKNNSICTYIFAHSQPFRKNKELYVKKFNELCKEHLHTNEFFNPYQTEDIIQYNGSENLKLALIWAKKAEVNEKSPNLDSEASAMLKNSNLDRRNRAKAQSIDVQY